MTRKTKTNKRSYANSAELDITDGELNRRTFLKTGVAATAVVGLGGLALKGRQLAVATTSQTTTDTDPFAARQITLNVNGTDYKVTVEPRDMLVNVIRDNLGLIGTKRPCNRMECGGCTVLIDDIPHNSCNFIALRAQGKKILTVEGGVASTAKGAPAPDLQASALIDAWVEEDGGQCGFCSPGQIMSAAALLKHNTNPSVSDIQAAQSGNLCRCGNYPNIVRSIQLAAKNLAGGS